MSIQLEVTLPSNRLAINLPQGRCMDFKWSSTLLVGGGRHDSGSGIIFHKKSIGLHIILYTHL